MVTRSDPEIAASIGEWPPLTVSVLVKGEPSLIVTDIVVSRVPIGVKKGGVPNYGAKSIAIGIGPDVGPADDWRLSDSQVHHPTPGMMFRNAWPWRLPESGRRHCGRH
jgi:hypothetical protein